MAEAFLNGRVVISSLAAPSEEDLRILNNLSEEERKTIVSEALQRAETSPKGTRTPEQIWEAARARAAELTPKHAI